MFEIWICDDNGEPHGVQPLAIAGNYADALALANERAVDFPFGAVIVTPSGNVICGDETPAQLAEILGTP